MSFIPSFPPAVTCLPLVHQGKVRDTFALPGHPGLLLMVASDRISTHNIVHESTIPRKGEFLTEISVFWMTQVLKETPSHLRAYGEDIYRYLYSDTKVPDLHLRAIVVSKLTMVPVEFIFRDRLAGSLLKSYASSEANPYGLVLPRGLSLMSEFPEGTIFTPTDKSETDDPLNSESVLRCYPQAYATAKRAYEKGRTYATGRGIEIIDGKFEVGYFEGGLGVYVTLGDECLTPDSCRFVDANDVAVGKEPSWLDKQYVRDYAESAWAGGKKVPLVLPPEVCEETTRRYQAIRDRLVR